MAENKINFPKLKDLGSMNLKDIGKLLKKKNGEEKGPSNSKLKKILSTKIEKPRNVVSFDIGTNSIKIVGGKYYKEKLNISQCIDMPTPEGAIADGRIINMQALTDIIQFNLDQSNINAKDAIVTTNSSLVINREITIPKVQDDEMETVIRYEIQQYLPINLEDYVLQFTVLDEVIQDNSAKLKVHVISYPEKMARSYYDLLTKLNLNPYALDVTYNSLNKISSYSTLINKEDISGGTVAFVDMGATSINVTIFKNGKLDFTRMIKSGGDNIDHGLNQRLNISIKSTESVKVEQSNLKNIKEDDSVNLVIKEMVDYILEDLEKIFQFYRNKVVGNTIDKIYIYGGTANIKFLDRYMKERFNISTEKINTIENVEFTSKELKEQSMEQYLNAIGAIIRL